MEEDLMPQQRTFSRVMKVTQQKSGTIIPHLMVSSLKLRFQEE